MNTYCLLDTRGMLLRAYYGSSYKTISTPDGDVASWQDGLASFIERTLLPLLSTYSPRQIYACFDAGNNYRRMLYAGYKEHRREAKANEDAKGKAASEQIAEMTEQAKRLLAYLGARVVWVPGEEADDLMALFCQRLEADAIMVVTRDEDLLQLCDDRTTVQYLDELYTKDSLVKGFPVTLTRIKKSIVGDSSDRYVGVKGAGPAFFQSLYETYGTEGLLQIEQHIACGNPSGLDGSGCKLLQKLFDQRSEWMLGYKLAALAPQACYGVLNGAAKRPEWYVRVPDRDKVFEIFRSVGLDMKFDVVDGLFPQERLIIATEHEQLVEALGNIKDSPIVSYDFETTDLVQHAPFREIETNFVDVLSSTLTGLSINYGDNLQHTFYVPFDHKDTANFGKDWAVWILQMLDALPVRPVVQNANFELTVAAVDLGHRSRAPFDTATIASYVDENQESGLKQNSLEWLRYTQTSYKEVTQGRGMHELTGDEVLSYGCDDSLVTSHLFDVKRTIMQLEGSWDFYVKNEVEPVFDDVSIFIEGTAVDLGRMAELRLKAEEGINAGMRQLHRLLEESCNATAHTDTVTAAAKLLLDEWWMMAATKYEDRPEESAKAYQKLWEKAWNGCFYNPPVIEREEVKFVPTPAQLTKVMRLLDATVPPLEKITGRGVEEWYRSVQDHVREMPEGEPRALLDELVGLLYAARGNLPAGKRSGPAYLRFSEHCLALLSKYETGRVTLSGDHLNTNSSDQMMQLLYGKMRLPLRRRSKVQIGSTRHKRKLKGSPATGLKAIAAALVYDVKDEDDWRYPALHAYAEVSKLQQELSLYFNKYPLLVHPRDGRLHPSFKQCGTATRRPTGTNPNDLQVKKGGEIRKTYIGGDYGDGKRVYVCADVSNEELVIAACESRDPVMLDAFMSTPRKDLHSVTAVSFAETILSRQGLPWDGKLDYETFSGVLHGKIEASDEHKAAFKNIRNKYAKACIAEGSLVLTDVGLVPIEKVELHHKVWDGVEWVTHEGVVYKGIREVITYDGVTATPDHVVFTDDGRKVQIGDLSCEQGGPRIAVGEVNGLPVRYTKADSTCLPEDTEERECLGREREAVYDIVNAGPLHRYTVSGRIVHNCNFLIAYMGSHATLAENLLMPEDLAKEIMGRVFVMYPRLQPWQREVIDFAMRHGYTETAYGNRRHAPKDLWSSDDSLSRRVQRQVVNFTIQGTAADILKEIRQAMKDRDMVRKYRLRAVKPVYDELSASVPLEAAGDYAEELVEIMSVTPPGYPVGMKIDLSIGKSWGDVKELEDTQRAAIDETLLHVYD